VETGLASPSMFPMRKEFRREMGYKIKAHKTLYKDVMFRSRLEARWAAFFDLAGWRWEYEPIDLEGWSPDFRIDVPCGHSECGGGHSVFVEVKPYYDADEFKTHPVTYYRYGEEDEKKDLPLDSLPVDAVAGFGANPDVAFWDMEHGAGSGIYTPKDWTTDVDLKWKKAGNIVQYQYKKRK